MSPAPKRRSARQIFATNLRVARKALGISQEELAHLAGLHRTYVGSVERGERNISVDSMECLARSLGLMTFQLLMADFKPVAKD